MNEIWTEKYRPKSLNEFKGNSSSVQEILKWIKNWKNEKNKSVLICGGPGTGKTSIAFVLANLFNYELVDTNSSDIRTKDSLINRIEQAAKQKSFFKKGKIILIDEADGLSSGDRGGISEISKIISESRYPVILTANDAYSSKLSSLRAKCKIIKFRAIHQSSITERLKEICKIEKIEFEKGTLKAIARRASGDLRSAINDLEYLARKYKKIDLGKINELSFRDIDQDIFQALMIIFKTKNFNTAMDSVKNLTEDYGMLFNWIRENVPLEYEQADEIALAYDFLSKADIFYGRIRKRQHWGFLKYSYDILCGGVAISKKEKYHKFTKYRFPTNIKKRSVAKAKKALRKEVSSKFSKKLHISTVKVIEEIEFLKLIISQKEMKTQLKESFKLSSEEIKYIENF